MLRHETETTRRYISGMTHERILVFITGGTIDAQYDPAVATPYHVPVPATTSESAVPEAMRRMGIDRHCDFYRYCMKDSKDITDGDMDEMLHIAEAGEYDKVLFVTGTDRMAELGQYVERMAAARGAGSPLEHKTFLFTGAMGPLRNAKGALRNPERITLKNDGWSNLRAAVEDLEHGDMKPGAYVRMGEHLWPAYGVKKVVHLDGTGPDAKVTDSEFQGVTAAAERGTPSK